MNKLDEIASSSLKPKEKLIKLSRALLEDKTLIPSVIERYGSAKDSDKGMWMEALELASEAKPEFLAPHLDFVIGQINHKAPRVRWESARLIANIAKDYPDKAAEAIPALLKNTNDPGTVVRWSAAMALGALVEYSEKARKTLAPKLEALEAKETNNGVKKMYSKALKTLGKSITDQSDRFV